MSKIDHSLFSAHEHALEDAFGDCPDCGKPLHIKKQQIRPFYWLHRLPRLPLQQAITR